MEKPPALEPDAIAAFKEQLGIHASEDANFGWIAEVGLQSPLPPRWTSHEDPDSGFIYYVDHDRQTSSWENPLVPHLRHVVEIGRSFLQSPSEGFFEDQKGVLWHQHKHLLDCWQGPFTDGEGRKYFINPSEEVSSWQDPRVDAQYIFELESGLLATLEDVLPSPWSKEDTQCWRTSNGAEVLTLDGSPASHAANTPMRMKTAGWRDRGGPVLLAPAQLQSLAQQKAKDEAMSTLEKMSAATKRIQSLQQDDEEAQRLAFLRKVEERKRGRESRQSTPSTDVPSASPLGPPPTPPPLAVGPPAKAAIRPQG